MPNFRIVSDFGMSGDQPRAAERLMEVEGEEISIVVASSSMLASICYPVKRGQVR